MAVAFSNTTRSLKQDSPRFALAIWACAIVMLCAWLAWFCLDRVTIYEVSQSAQVEAQQSSRLVSALIAGRIVAAPVKLGQQVRAGDILFELDAGQQRLQLQEQVLQANGLPPKIVALQAEISALEAARRSDLAAARSAQQSALFRKDEARASADFAADNAQRLVQESKAGSVSKLEALRAQSQARELSSAYHALESEAQRQQNDAQARNHSSEAQIESRRRELAMLQADLATSGVSTQRVSQDVEKFVVRAPIDGRIGDVAPFRVGAYVAEGQTLASVIPGGRLIIVAQFAPSSVQGRIHLGQKGRINLDGYPWAQYGQVYAKVSAVSSDIRDGHIRVELEPVESAASQKLLKHGLLGKAEISVEQVSPLAMVARAVGASGQDKPSDKVATEP